MNAHPTLFFTILALNYYNMANPEHLNILEQGVDVWNKWRKENPDVKPDLNGAELNKMDFSNANFSDTRMEFTQLTNSNLTETNFYNAQLFNAFFNRAKVIRTDFTDAQLRQAVFAQTEFSYPNFFRAGLTGTKFFSTNLNNADFIYVFLYDTEFINTNLETVKNLDECIFGGPCVFDHRTLAKSNNLSTKFLRDCGLPDEIVNTIPVLQGNPIQFYSSFISHSSKDKEFVERLYSDLQAKGISCWYAPEDLKIGDKIRPTIEGAIKIHDKLMIVLSEDSINSQWVENEVEAALAREQEGNRTLIFPIMLDKTIFDTDNSWAATIRRTRNIGDFTKWKDHDSYTNAFGKLLEALKKSEV